MDDQIKQAQSGSRDAMAAVVAEYYPAVFRFCAHRLGQDLAADAAQETFVTMQRSIKKYQGRSEFKTWLLGIAHNHCRVQARKRKLEPAPLEEWMSGSEAGHESAAINRETLRQAIRGLSPEHREVVLLHEIEELRYSEIAELLGVPEGTVKSRLHHAFLNLRRQLCGAEGGI